MSGLFDLIKGVALLAGGAKASRMDEEKAASENKYREESIAVQREKVASEKEMAAAQRAHTELLQKAGFGHEEKMFEKKIDWESKRLGIEQAFAASESKLLRDNAKELANLRIAAEKEIQGKELQSRADLQDKDLKMKWAIEKLKEGLEKQGFTLKEKQMSQDFTLGKMGVLINAVGLAQKHTQGVEGLYTSISKTNKGMAQILSSQEQANLDTILTAIDPDGKMGLKGLKISNYVTPISQETSEAADKLAEALKVPKPDIPITVPKAASIMDQVAIAPSGKGDTVLDFRGRGSSDEIHPGDQIGLDRVSSDIMKLPDAERPAAFGEWSQYINDPNTSFMGGQDDPEYRKKVLRYLGKTTGFDITK